MVVIPISNSDKPLKEADLAISPIYQGREKSGCDASHFCGEIKNHPALGKKENLLIAGESSLVKISTCNMLIERLQIAQGSDWENCLVFEREEREESSFSERDFLTADNLAIEAFFDLPEENITAAFVGIRLTNNITTRSFMQNVIKNFNAGHGYTLGRFIFETENLLFAKLFDEEPDFLELGIVNFWNSFGSVRFWRKGDGLPEKSLADALAEHPEFYGELPGIPAVESAFLTPVPHWFGLPTLLQAAKTGK